MDIVKGTVCDNCLYNATDKICDADMPKNQMIEIGMCAMFARYEGEEEE